MFRHRHANTTNLVERMWQYVKYTLLDGKVNRRLDELIFAIIGNPNSRRRFGGLTVDEHYNNVYCLNKSRKYSIRKRRQGPNNEVAKGQENDPKV